MEGRIQVKIDVQCWRRYHIGHVLWKKIVVVELCTISCDSSRHPNQALLDLECLIFPRTSPL